MKARVSIGLGGAVIVATVVACGDPTTPSPGPKAGSDTVTPSVLIGAAVDTSLGPGEFVQYALSPDPALFSPDSTVLDPESTLFFAAFGRTAAPEAERRTVTIDVFDDAAHRVAGVLAVGSDPGSRRGPRRPAA